MKRKSRQTLRIGTLGALGLGYLTTGLAAGCKAGFVPREAAVGDKVCVTPASRSQAAAENARAPLLWMPGTFGSKTCAQGYVWRLTSPTDLICVSPGRRSDVAQENTRAAQNSLP